MNHDVNRYELEENVTIETLKEAGFREIKSGNRIILSYYRELIKDIDLFIEFDITNPNIITFDVDKNISVIDDICGQYLNAFYDNVDNDYINRVVRRYNEVMNSLVNKGIFKVKEKVVGKQFKKLNNV